MPALVPHLFAVPQTERTQELQFLLMLAHASCLKGQVNGRVPTLNPTVSSLCICDALANSRNARHAQEPTQWHPAWPEHPQHPGL